MYIIKMTDNKELINCSYDKKIYQKETLVDELMFLVPHKYNDISLKTFNVALEYIDAAKTPHVEVLNKSDDYKEYMAYTLPIDTAITTYSGNVRLNLSLSKVDIENKKHYILHSGETVIPILERKDYYNFVPDESLEFVDKVIANIDAKIQAVERLADEFDKSKADNLSYSGNKLQLTSNGQPIGNSVDIVSCGSSGTADSFEIVEF